MSLTSADIDYIQASGRDPAEIARQIEFLQGQRQPAPILRPAIINDGIERFSDHDPAVLADLHAQAAAAGRLSSFVPASGSGTRLFQSLFELYRDRALDAERIRERAAQGDVAARDALIVIENIEAFAIWDELAPRGCSPDSIEEILNTLFDNSGARYHELPKGLIPFHRYLDGVRSAFIEHVIEAVLLTADSEKNCRIHFTITTAHAPRFQEEWNRERPRLEKTLGARLQVDFSGQAPSTDTIAIDLEGKVQRDSSGKILFRPGGHGALLGNLAACGGDIVLIKNIDNVARQEHSIEITGIRKKISGLLLLIEIEVHKTIRHLRQGQEASTALHFLAQQFGRTPPVPLTDETARRAWAIDQLNRPLRVCGVVATLDQAGGRPFWLATKYQDAWLQIVEGAEVDLEDPQQRDLFHSSRHFNPVDIACSLRDLDGQPFDLKLFTDPSRALIAQKTLAGVPSLIYEHPGLWNGSMAFWNTVFVEVPDFTFNPVKSLSDLWSARHRESA
jgi:hypothetical protein